MENPINDGSVESEIRTPNYLSSRMTDWVHTPYFETYGYRCYQKRETPEGAPLWELHKGYPISSLSSSLHQLYYLFDNLHDPQPS